MPGKHLEASVGMLQREEPSTQHPAVKRLPGKRPGMLPLVTPRRFYCSLLCNAVLTAITTALAMVLAVRVPWNQRESRVPEVRMFSSCPRDWIGFGSKCFYFSEDIRDWTSSQAFCEAEGANLAQFDSKEELNFLKKYKSADDHWLGLRRESAQHSWKWANHTEFSNFVEVRGAGECAYLNQNGISSARGYVSRKWTCSKLSSFAECRASSSSASL